MVPAHDQTKTIRLLTHYPEHVERSSDPDYRLFHKAVARIRAAGLYRCWVCGTEADLEVHHTLVEYALANAVDWVRLASLFPEFHIEDEAGFRAFVEGEGNLTVYCRDHHTGHHGVHNLPFPEFTLLRYLKAGCLAPEVL